MGNYRVDIGGDLIMAIDGQPIREGSDFTRLLGRKRPGDTVELTVYRDGRAMKVKVQLGGSSDNRL